MPSFWELLVAPLLEAAGPKRIVEVGAGRTGLTRALLRWSVHNNASVDLVDLADTIDDEYWQTEFGQRLRVHLGGPLPGLGEVEAADVAVLATDPNYYTTFACLELLERRGTTTGPGLPLTLVTQVGWPYGRRDGYRDLGRIPPIGQQPALRGGVVPGVAEPREAEGLHSERWHALEAHEVRNGVLSAVEDFARSRPGLEVLTLDAFGGIAVLADGRHADVSPKVKAIFARTAGPVWLRALTDRLEAARLDTAVREAALNRELANAQRHAELLAHEIEAADARTAQAIQRAEEAEGRVQEAEGRVSDAHAQAELIAEHERTVTAQQTTLRRRAADIALIKRDVERLGQLATRLEASRSWRLGHGVMQVVSRLTLRRRPVTAGGAAALIKSLEQVSQQLDIASRGELSLTSGTSGSELVQHSASDVIPAPRPLTEQESAARQEQLAALRVALRRRLGAARRVESPPPVSIVVLNRNGEPHLRRLLDGLEHATDYPELELIVFDNGSTDGSLALLEAATVSFPVEVIAHDANASFSDANNVAAERARHDLILFLNNDVEPVDEQWLTELVAVRQAGAAAVAATLFHGTPDPHIPSGWRLQHQGIRFRREDGRWKGFNLGDGEDGLAAVGLDTVCPAVTGAALLIGREDFESVGGFTLGYRYGTEDVDLGLKLTAKGRRVVCSGRAVLLHHESSTQNVEGRVFMADNRRRNREIFWATWGPAINRQCLSDALENRGFWTVAGTLHIAITVTSVMASDGWGDWYTARELGDALELLGFRVSYIQRKHDDWASPPADLDVTIALLDKFDVSRARYGTTVAWIRNWTDRWIEHAQLERFDVLLPSSATSQRRLREAGLEGGEVMPLATNVARFVPRDGAKEFDYVFTGNHWGEDRAVIDALDPRNGERCGIFGRGWAAVDRLAPWWQGERAYADLPGLYAKSLLAIDDAAFHTLPYGAVNARVFDALAAGALPITNGVSGVHELFDEDFPTWSSRESLRATLDELLGDDERRRELVERYATQVREHHTYDHRAAQVRGALAAHVGRRRWCINIGAPDWARAAHWGDLYFAQGLQAALRRHGHECLIQTLDEWDSLDSAAYDVVLHLKGRSAYTPRPGQFNILWIISHPDLVTDEECERYDLVCVASESFAAALADRVEVPVVPLLQATSPAVFRPDGEYGTGPELLFVANSRKVERRIMVDLLPTDRDLAVYGADWNGSVAKHVRSDFVPNDEVAGLYSRASIVLNDHWDDMREHGFISNRIFDALACGAVVLSDRVEGLEKVFGDAVVTYENPDDLKSTIESVLADPEPARDRAARGRELVLHQHTLEQRVDRLIALVEEHHTTVADRARMLVG